MPTSAEQAEAVERTLAGDKQCRSCLVWQQPDRFPNARSFPYFPDVRMPVCWDCIFGRNKTKWSLRRDRFELES